MPPTKPVESFKLDPNKFVYFDLGNVLVHFDHDIAVQNVAQLSGREAQVVKEAIFASGLQDRLETGLMTSAQFADTLIGKLECQLSSQPLLEAISDIFKPNAGIVVILEQLKRAGVPMAVLSNTCEPHWLWLLRQNWPVITGWFDFYVLSYEARSMKPDEGIYQVSEQRSGRQPQHLFFTDDRADNVSAAAARGWATHQFRTVEALAAQLGPWLGIELSTTASAATNVVESVA
ncbi:MAG: HAD family phosphatase [Pirellulaceae bacterium]|nr:HAD family phosphatase [Pirellulaceae bacterium]